MAPTLKSFFLLTLCGLCVHMASSGIIEKPASASHNLFAANIFSVISESRKQENLVFSPASIQASMALVYLGAEGLTAQEIQKGLQLSVGDKQAIATKYGDFLKVNFNKQDGAELKMANAIFVDDSLQLSPKFAQLATQSFNSTAKSLHFANSDESINNINAWVESQTNSKIKNLLQPGSVDQDTSSVLVNALYLKAKWAVPFSKEATEKTDFALNSKERVKVDMMFSEDDYKYGEFDNLNATVLEMKYNNTDLTMMILLPKNVDGLADLENNLKNVDLQKDVSEKLETEDVRLLLPKFKIEFEIDLKDPLHKLGVSKLFSDNADLSFFEPKTQQKVSEAKHKAYLEVNESGTEAAAATYMKIVPMSLNLNQKTFFADHPFVFAVRNSQTVFFVGHVAKL